MTYVKSRIKFNTFNTFNNVILTKYIMQKDGAQNVNAKHHVLKYVRNIILDKRMEHIFYINYPQSIYKCLEPTEIMISTPKDFGQYLQNKRNRRRKK